jgi:hypothetical protein
MFWDYFRFDRMTWSRDIGEMKMDLFLEAPFKRRDGCPNRAQTIENAD